MKTGKIGEGLVAVWAAQAGLVANKVGEDEFGWDYCIQIPSNAPSTLPLDLVPAELTFYVQVKTTAKAARSESVKLSNWQRMVKDSNPWFFIRIELDTDGEPERAYLIHVDREWMSNVLKRLRELPPEVGDELNRRTIDLTWSDADAIAVPFGKNLRKRIEEIVGDPAAYALAKVENFRTLGYKKARYQVTISTPYASPADIERHVDFAIGIEKRLAIRSMRVSDIRFDLPHVLQDQRDADGHMEFATPIPSIATTNLVFANREKTRRVRMQCATYVPTLLLGKVPPEYFKVRFAAPMISIVVDPKTESMTFGWRIPETPMPLSDFAKVGSLISVVAGAQDGGITIAYENGGVQSEFARQDSPIPVPVAMRELAAAADHAAFLANDLGLPFDLPVVAADLHEELLRLTAVRAVCEGKPFPFKFSVVIPTDVGTAITHPTAAIVVPINALIGDQVVAIAIAAGGVPEWSADEGRLTITNGAIDILEKWVVPVDDWEAFGVLEKAAALARKFSETEKYALVIEPEKNVI